MLGQIVPSTWKWPAESVSIIAEGKELALWASCAWHLKI